jgi:membrane-bound ClpP family serine protease
MTHVLSLRRVASGAAYVLEHTVAVVLGLIMMIVGLGLGVTMVMLPVGITIGLLGVAVLVSGLFTHIDRTER